MIEWNKPCIWTCNFDNDPRHDPAVAEYLKHVTVVVEIRDREGENSWGKLFNPPVVDGTAMEDLECEEGLEEARRFAGEDCIDETVDLDSNGFGI